MVNLNPLEIKITDITLEKFYGKDKMSIMPQFVEAVFYQSIFEPFIRVDLLVNDQIGLFVNYPLTGEELITLTYEQVDIGFSISTPKQVKLIIKEVRDVVAGDRARSLMYVMECVSPQYLQNTRKYVSHAYNDLVENAAEELYLEYIGTDTQAQYNVYKPFVKEESIKIRSLVVPNLRPFQAIMWLAKHAVAKDYNNHFLYLFYEDLENFNFVTIQKLIEDAKKNRQELRNKKFVYYSDTEIGRQTPVGDIDKDTRIITNLVFNKRMSSIEKITGGYFQNELFEISLLQKSYNSTPSELTGAATTPTLEKFPLNTKDYINYVKNEKVNTEYANRIRYIINNYDDFNNDQGLTQPNYRYKFGNTARYLHALNQIDLSITVPANMSIKPGQIIYCEFPEMHGFNNVINDIYLSGFFIISEVKQVISAGNKATTSLRIYKDGYLTEILEDSEYNLSSAPLRTNSSGRPIGTV
jgi:hypothetical protein